MSVHELTDPNEARRFLLGGLWLPRVARPSAESVPMILEWVRELASGGEPIPPVGLVADVGHIVFGFDRAASSGDVFEIHGWTDRLATLYEDHVLGKLYADASFARAADALGRYQGRDRAQGLAFLLDRFRDRAGLGGVHLNPAAVKAVLDRPPAEALTEGWDGLERDGLPPWLPSLYEDLVRSTRGLGDILGAEDVFELEHATALAPFGERIALRQVLQAADAFETGLAQAWPRPPARRHDVPTRVLDEDTYPVGGFSSISTRGSVESLLHSQLAYMEPAERPDLFDIKFLRDELLYYSRDENQFLRQRRSYVFALFPDLAHARFKDAELPRQRIVLLLALLIAAVRKLTEWLHHDALLFEFLFVQNGDDTLDAERALIEMVLREAIANGTVVTVAVSSHQLVAHCEARARRSLCHCLSVATTDRPIEAEGTLVTRLRIDGPRPALGVEAEGIIVAEADDALESWQATLDSLLPLWV